MSINKDSLNLVIKYLTAQELQYPFALVCKSWNDVEQLELEKEATKRYSQAFVNTLGLKILNSIPCITSDIEFEGNDYTRVTLEWRLLDHLVEKGYNLARFTVKFNKQLTYGIVCFLQINEPNFCDTKKVGERIRLATNIIKLSSRGQKAVATYFKRLINGQPCGLQQLSAERDERNMFKETQKITKKTLCCCCLRETSSVSLLKGRMSFVPQEVIMDS